LRPYGENAARVAYIRNRILKRLPPFCGALDMFDAETSRRLKKRARRAAKVEVAKGAP